MPTQTKITDCGINPTLCRAVIRQIGDRDSLEDVARHGASGGFCGFTYHKDTVAFFKRHRAAIVELVKQQADDFGQPPLDMVAGFNCLRPCDEQDKESICRCLYGGRLKDGDTNVANALAWFALEEVARALNPDL
jgi:hypothetical protein